MIANSLMFLSIAVGVLALCDLLMSEHQKRFLSDCVLRLWNWLDELNTLSFLDWFRRPRVQRNFTVIAVSAGCVVPLLISPLLLFIAPEALWGWVTAYIIVMVGSTFAGAKIISLMLKAESPFKLIVRTTAILLLTLVPLVGVYIVDRFTEKPELDIVLGDDVLFSAAYGGLSYALAVLTSPNFLISVCLITVSVLLLMFWCVAAGPVIFSYLIMGTLRALEIVVRRIAEYPKGPILAISAFCGGIAALLKAIGN